MIDELERRIADTALLNNKLILLIGPPRSGKTALLGQLSGRMKVPVLNAGLALGRDLLGLPRTRRHLQVSELFRQKSFVVNSPSRNLRDDDGWNRKRTQLRVA